MSPTWKPANVWHSDAAFSLVAAFGWNWVTPWHFTWAPAIADEATFQIAKALNRSRADSEPARRRWWRIYSAFPEVYREAASKVWESQITNARNVGG